MENITFIQDTRKQDIVTALMSGQSKVHIDGVEIILKELKRDTTKRKQREAEKQAEQIIKLL